jgi:beta-glucanase (GH16 family)
MLARDALLASLLAVVMLCTIAQSSRRPNPTRTTTATGPAAFDDEFSGSSLNTTTWTALNRPGDASNSEQQCYRPGNAAVVSGALVLSDKQDSSCSGYSYTSAMLQTATYHFTYGTFEVRAQMPTGTGQWPALWLLGANCQATYPTSPDNAGACQWPTPGSDELDMYEGKGNPAVGAFNLEEGTSPNNADLAYGCNGVALPFDTSAGYHTYDLVWAPGSLTWQIDGVTYCSTTSNVPTTAMFLLLNIALGGAGGTIDPAVLPQTMHIDYVRVYQ